jgi:hypothetical protein
MLRTPSKAEWLIVRRIASKDFFQTFDENIRWFDARLHDLFELQSSFQFLGGHSGGTRLLGVAQSVSFVFHRCVLYCNGPNRFDKYIYFLNNFNETSKEPFTGAKIGCKFYVWMPLSTP